MNTDVTALSPPLPLVYSGTARVREIAVHRVETLDVTFTDPSGRAVRLSVERETSLYALTYDHRAALGPGTGLGRAPRNSEFLKELRADRKGLKHDLKGMGHGLRGALKDPRAGGTYQADELFAALRDMRAAVNGFRRILHRFLKAVDPRYADTYRVDDPVEGGIRVLGQEHAGILAVQQTVTISVDGVPDPEQWSVEATALRLANFATSLFTGGDRGKHLEKMVAGMEQGYQEAAEAFGGTLPPIARQTVDRAGALLARWARADESPKPAPELSRFEAVA